MVRNAILIYNANPFNATCIVFQIIALATKARNLTVKTANAFLNYGCATPTMTVAMIAMSRRICVDKETARPDGNDVQDTQIIGAFQSGYSATVKMTVAMVPTSVRRAARNAIPTWTLSVPTTDACRNSGCATLPTTVETAATNSR